ncbi:tetratricopeptide repeat protein [Christiangramia portivictoriae]|uniref:tetratricopeptide repeat protein n=1 Tax=Christiangramia portivictoriae TaxID=326069 RepID=UPI0003FDF834|nr:tetratricopeptide repeat protein [Christiangramia portivictoriae]
MQHNTGFKIILSILLFHFGIIGVFAQKDQEKLQQESNEYIVEAQEALSENKFANAEASYRKVIAKDPSNMKAKYNMGNLYYAKEKSLNAEQRLKEAAEIAETKEEKHQIFHNLGNSYMQQKNYQEAVNAYKNALRNNPADDETRYNLALAKKKLEEEKQNPDQNDEQNQDKQDNKENKDQNQDQKDQNNDGEGGDDEKQDQKPKDEGENEKDKKEGDQNEDKDKQDGDENKDDKGKGDEKQQQKPKPAQGKLSPQQIQSLLEAMNNEEKKVQDKINAQKAKGVKVKAEKDW